ncbi:MAG TPA: GNAT family N-acetyltransferase [Ktedonobacteraceae bacterium]|nr:GNAT family N-acetyltransferase [Ktedonobacteraceae bacterium]
MSIELPYAHYDLNMTRDLGNGLCLRWSTPEDTEELAYLTSMVFRDSEDAPPNTNLGNLMREFMSGQHPLMGPRDFVIVEDTRRSEHRIVACTCYWSQAWEYEGIHIGLGRPEIVATDPAYRNRGLVRALFEEVHARSETQGDLAQGITGIGYFYRQFGYEYALNLGGRCTTNLSLIPQAKEPEPYVLRDAGEADISFILSLYDRRRRESIVSMPMEERWLRYHIKTWNVIETDDNWHLQIVSDRAGTAMGFLLTPVVRWGRQVEVYACEIVPEANMQAVVPSILRAVAAQGAHLRAKPGTEPLSEVSFNLGATHPVYEVLGSALTSRRYAPYAWYVRVPDVPRFLRHIAPVLERRLAESPLGRFTGELCITLYRGGLHLVFEDGTLMLVEPWRSPSYGGSEDAGIPPLVFLQLLFGYRSLDDLRFAFPDVWVKDEAELLLKTLFPMKPSWVLPIG